MLKAFLYIFFYIFLLGCWGFLEFSDDTRNSIAAAVTIITSLDWFLILWTYPPRHLVSHVSHFSQLFDPQHSEAFHATDTMAVGQKFRVPQRKRFGKRTNRPNMTKPCGPWAHSHMHMVDPRYVEGFDSRHLYVQMGHNKPFRRYLQSHRKSRPSLKTPLPPKDHLQCSLCSLQLKNTCLLRGFRSAHQPYNVNIVLRSSLLLSGSKLPKMSSQLGHSNPSQRGMESQK